MEWRSITTCNGELYGKSLNWSYFMNTNAMWLRIQTIIKVLFNL